MKTSEQKNEINIFWPCCLTFLADIMLAATIILAIGQATGNYDWTLGALITTGLLTRGGATDMRISMWIEKRRREINLDGGSQ